MGEIKEVRRRKKVTEEKLRGDIKSIEGKLRGKIKDVRGEIKATEERLCEKSINGEQIQLNGCLSSG